MNKQIFFSILINFFFIQTQDSNFEKEIINFESIDEDDFETSSNKNFNLEIIEQFEANIDIDNELKLLKKPYLTIIGFTNFNNGLGRVSLGIINCFEEFDYNFIQTQKCYFEGLSLKAISAIKKNNGDQNPGNFIILTDVLKWKQLKNHKLIPNYPSSIKIAYSMFETTKIPDDWVKILNQQFDLVIVPDYFLVNVYKNSGVNIPIFILPCGIYIEEMLNKADKKQTHYPFTFGCSAAFNKRKNHKILIDAFIKEFKNQNHVKLKINGLPYGKNSILNEIKTIINKFNVKNIQLTCNAMPWNDYIDFLTSLDCYISISKGEGFSIPPREAYALGIPCILTNNTAQKTLCQTGFSKIVHSTANEQATYPELFGNENLGFFHNCSLEDVRKALKDVYDNYNQYLQKGNESRKWVQKYCWSNLQKRFINLIKPKKIILSTKNLITKKFLMTNSKALYEKYKEILKT